MHVLLDFNGWEWYMTTNLVNFNFHVFIAILHDETLEYVPRHWSDVLTDLQCIN